MQLFCFESARWLVACVPHCQTVMKRRTGTALNSRPQILSINPAKFLGLVADWALPWKPWMSGFDLCQCAYFTTLAGMFWFQWDFFIAEEAKRCSLELHYLFKESPWEHHPGRWNEPVLVFSLFFSPFVDCLVCTRKPSGLHCYGKQMSLRKTNDSYRRHLTNRVLLQFTLSSM